MVQAGTRKFEISRLVRVVEEEAAHADEGMVFVLEGYGYRWYRVGGLDYLLRRTDIDRRDTDVD